MNIQSAERVSQTDVSDNYVYQRSILAYYRAAEMVSGHVLEIGTGSGYGVALMAPRVESFVTIDKHNALGDNLMLYPNVEFHQMTVPPLRGIASNSFDYVICFQVIEHIRRDFLLLEEVRRVLRPGGRLIISTPNKKMSLTRNPWHVREYSADEFKNLLESHFDSVETLGVYGNEKVSAYYDKNKRSVERITRFDILRLQYNLPRCLLRIPYDILNRFNRRKLLVSNHTLTASITRDDYRIAPVGDACYDLFYIARK